VDGLPEHHDVRRQPATYQRILQNIEGREINVHWVITRPMLSRPDYLQEYVSFWSARPEVNRIWVSVYTPQLGEQSAETLTPEDRQILARRLSSLNREYPKLLLTDGMAEALLHPPSGPEDCLFSRMSANYSADLQSRVEPCVFGGAPDCSQCGCAISSALHWIRSVKVVGPVKVGHFVKGSIAVGTLMNRLRSRAMQPSRWRPSSQKPKPSSDLVQIQP